MSSSNLKTVILRDDNIFVNEKNQEIPKDSIIHCLGSLFKLTDSGLSHVVGKIDDNTYFANPHFFHKLNEFAFSEQTDVTSTPEAAPQKKSLLASVYRLMTAPFTIRTLQSVTTRTRKRKSSPVILVSTTENTDISTQTENQNSSMKVPPPNEMFLLNNKCEKSITDEVQFIFKIYQDFITSKHLKLVAVLSALNATNTGCYNDLRIRYPGFLLELPVIDINKLTSVIQSIFPTQVLQYSLGDRIKNTPSLSKKTKNENMEEVGLFPPKGKNPDKSTNQSSSPIDTGKFNEHVGKPKMDQLVEEVNEDLNERGSYQPSNNQDDSSRCRLRSPESVE